eukprot:CAMPEP_0184705530 /NCGR_PEP_ID=MMETSP0313-20130426/34703_1 /TAXON_ID=2792 /ORGANISM="Porphyridium aerugineum, Strain SAG 1380-2" /LENGTH=33 /DNA_ID= /DNA_START= /DNA_END= /DNA_ORIENTATION=
MRQQRLGTDFELEGGKPEIEEILEFVAACSMVI